MKQLLGALFSGFKKTVRAEAERTKGMEGAQGPASETLATLSADPSSQPAADESRATIKTDWEIAGEQLEAKAEREAQDNGQIKGQAAAAAGEAQAPKQAQAGTVAMARLRGGAPALQERLREKKGQRHTADAGVSKSR